MAPITGFPQDLNSSMMLVQPSCVTQMKRANRAAGRETQAHMVIHRRTWLPGDTGTHGDAQEDMVAPLLDQEFLFSGG